jgi:hypothetical protein
VADESRPWERPGAVRRDSARDAASRDERGQLYLVILPADLKAA